MKLVKLSSVGMVTTYDYPKGRWKEKHRVLTGLIGPECELLESVHPQKLYKPFGGPMELGEAIMLVDEFGWFHNTIPNIRASQLYGDTIMGAVLFVGVDGEDFTGLTDEQVKKLTAYL